MLAITLARENQTSNYQPRQNEDSHFEIKVVNEGLFPEIRISLVSRSKEKNKSKVESEK
ncbi:MAG: hypothetical protein M1495_09820 [Bacteroidetes bacterium]|nr:hypothetical protein [Bacteroidota bacterium]